MPIYRVEYQYEEEGCLIIKADNAKQAREWAENAEGETLSNNLTGEISFSGVLHVEELPGASEADFDITEEES